MVTVKVSRPLPLIDVDNVLNPYPDTPAGYSEHAIFSEDEEPVRLCALHGEWLRELAERFTLAWGSSWGEGANLHLCPYFGLPALPVVPFPPAPFDASAKVPAMDSFVGDSAVAWVDDIVSAEARRWAKKRTPPTLLVEVKHAAGLTRDAVDELLTWRLALGWSGEISPTLA